MSLLVVAADDGPEDAIEDQQQQRHHHQLDQPDGARHAPVGLQPLGGGVGGAVQALDLRGRQAASYISK